MDLELELFMLFYTAIIFTILLVVYGRTRNTKIVFGVLSSLCWIVVGLVYVASAPTYPAIGLLFLGVALTLIFGTVYDTLQSLKVEKEEV